MTDFYKPSFNVLTLKVETMRMRTLLSRDETKVCLVDWAGLEGHSIIDGTMMTEQNRWGGRFVRGWTAQVRGIREGISVHGLSELLVLHPASTSVLYVPVPNSPIAVDYSTGLDSVDRGARRG
jgi:hypothetical protein